MSHATRGRLTKYVYFARALNSRPFTLLWSGQVISSLGDGAFTIALAWEVLLQTGSSVAMSMVIIAKSIPMLLFLLVGGVAADRLPRHLVMLYSDAGRALILFLLVGLGWAHLLQFWYLVVLSFLFGIVNSFFNPAYQALPKLLVEAKDLPSATVLKGLSRQGSILFGSLLGAGCIAIGGPLFAFAFDGLTFVVSAICLLAIRIPVTSPILQTNAQQTISQPSSENFVSLRQSVPKLFRDVREGMTYISSIRWLWISILIAAVSNIGIAAPLSVVLPKLVQKNYGENVWLLGTLVTVSAIGSVVAAFLIGQKQHLSRRGIVAYTALVICGIGLIMLGLPLPHSILLITSIIAGLLIGFGLSTFDVIWEILLQELVPSDKLGRVSSIDLLGSYCLLPLGYALDGILSDAIGPGWIFILGGLLILILTFLALSVRDIRSL